MAQELHNRNNRLTTGEHARLEKTEEETRSQQATVVLNEALAHGGETEEEHVDRQPHVRLELLEEDVGRNLEQTVRHEEDDECVVVLCAIGIVRINEFEVLGKVEDIGVGNVDAVCVVQLARALAALRAQNTYLGRPRDT